MYRSRYIVLGYTVHVSCTIERILECNIQDKQGMPEVGGILMGQVKNENIYIQKMTTPNQFDKASRFEFVRDKDAAQLILDYEFLNSERTVTYLGEWHTHPEANPRPSGQDISMIREQFLKATLNLPILLLLIQGITGRYVAAYDGGKLHRAKLEL